MPGEKQHRDVSFCVRNWFILITGILPWMTGLAGEDDFAFRVWDVGDGLPQNTVHAIAQTEDGYLWLGTDLGITRFDGVRFLNFGRDRLPGLPNKAIAHLHVDRQQRLWIITQDGHLGWLDKGKFKEVTWPDEIAVSPIWSFTEHEERFYLGLTKGGMLVLEDGHLRGESDFLETAVSHPLNLWADHSGVLWAGTVEGLRRHDQGKWQTALTESEIAFAFPPQRATPLLANTRGGVWVAAGNRLRKITQGMIQEDLALPWGTPQATRTLFSDRSGRLWIGAEGAGLHAFEPDGVSTFNMDNGLPSNHVLTLFEDREGNLWAGTDGGGLVRIRERRFKRVGPVEPLLNVPINSVVEDLTHDVWMATAGNGLIHWDGYRFHQVKGFEVTDIRSLIVDPSGIGWIGGEGIGVWKITPDGEDRIARFGHEILAGVEGENVRCLHRDRRGHLWVGMDDGLAVFKEGQRHLLTAWLGMENEGVTSIAEDGPNVWVGTTRGLFLIEPDRQRRLFDQPVFCLFVGPKEDVWAGLSRGVCRFHQGKTTVLASGSGFPDITIKSLLADAKGDLWAGTERGVFRCAYDDLVRLAEGQIDRVPSVLYDEEDGLTSLECSGYQPGSFISELGTLYVPTRRGLFRTEPEMEAEDATIPEPRIEEVWIDDTKSWDLAADASGPHAVTAPPGPRRISVGYTGIHLRAPEKVRFRYRLRGFREEWTEAGGRRMAEFQGLDPGRYELEIAAATHRGDWSERPARFSILVQPHVWQTWWFKALLALLLLGLGALLTQRVAMIRLRRQQFELEKVQAIARERTRIAEDMHDDLGARLTRIALIGEMAQSGAEEERIREMTGSAREAAASMDELVWAVNPKNDSLSRLASYLSGYVLEFCDTLAMPCQVDVPPILPEREVTGKLRHHLFLLVKELLNNVAKHASAKMVRFSLEMVDAELWMRLEDDGRGFDPKAKRGAGNGLEHLHSRLREFQGEATIRSADGGGTSVEIRVPLPHDDNSEPRHPGQLGG